jgi:hypothetical protein
MNAETLAADFTLLRRRAPADEEDQIGFYAN